MVPTAQPVPVPRIRSLQTELPQPIFQSNVQFLSIGSVLNQKPPALSAESKSATVKLPPTFIYTHVQQVRQYQINGNWTAAVELVVDQLPILCEHLPYITLATLLAPLPTSFVDSSPAVWLATGIIQATIDNEPNALAWLSRLDVSTLPHAEQLAWAYLERTHISCRCGAYPDAQTYLEQADTLLAQTPSPIPHLLPFSSYLRACLYAHTGRITEGVPLVQSAAIRFRKLDFVRKEFNCWLLLSSLNRQLGNDQAAAESLHNARSCFHSGTLDPSAYESILNTETQHAWYCGDLAGALEKAKTWVTFTQSSIYTRQRMRAHLVLGNLQRACGDYTQAHQNYDRARTLSTQLYPQFTCWIDVNAAWLAILQGQLESATRLVTCSLPTTSPDQQMSVQVTLAVIQLLKGQHAAAEDLLRAALAFYQRSQDRTSTCAIAFLLAWIYLHTHPTSRTLSELLRSELAWLANRDRAYFPHWWHPTLISQVAVWLLGVNECKTIGQRLFLEGFLGADGIHTLEAAAANIHLHHHREAVNLLVKLGAIDLYLTKLFHNTLARQVVTDAIQNGQLAAAMVPSLLSRLRTAHRHNRNNELAVAIFLLHLQKRSTHEIATLLERSPSSVTHTLQGIYEHMGKSRMHNRRATQLAEIYHAAKEQGLVC